MHAPDAIESTVAGRVGRARRVRIAGLRPSRYRRRSLVMALVAAVTLALVVLAATGGSLDAGRLGALLRTFHY